MIILANGKRWKIDELEASQIWTDIVTGKISLDDVTDYQLTMALIAQGKRYSVCL